MYKFKRVIFPGFSLVESRPEINQTHAKYLLPGVTTQNQNTFNLYLSGSFSVKELASGFTQNVYPGQTNLDVSFSENSASDEGTTVIEEATSSDCWRMCLSPAISSARWVRRVLSCKTDEVVSLEPGELAIVLIGKFRSPSRGLLVGDTEISAGRRALVPATEARLAVVQLL